MERRPDPQVRSVLLNLAGIADVLLGLIFLIVYLTSRSNPAFLAIGLALAVAGAILIVVGRAVRPKDPREPDSDRF